METFVEIEKLSKFFGPFKAVDRISFKVERGEVLGFLGPNGAGKSTTMKMIAGFLTPSAGSIRVAGFDAFTKPLETKRRIGYLPEGAPAYPDMTVIDFLDFIADIRGLRGGEKRGRVRKVMDQVNLVEVTHQTIETLSKGYKRRVGLAQAILHDPEVLVLDEPTDGLDPNQKHEVRALIREMAKEKAIILSTHILEEVHAVCTRALIIADGRIVADGHPADLEAMSPQHNSVSVTLHRNDEDPAQVRSALEAIASVERLETCHENDHQLAYRLYPRGARPIVVDVGHLARERGWELEELYAHQGVLDEVFRSVTEGHLS